MMKNRGAQFTPPRLLSKFNKLLLLSLAILVVTACTKDEIVDDNRLPEGQYPLQISGVTLDVESTAQPWNAPQSRVTEDNSDGMSSVWQWDGSEMIGVQLGNETANYTLNADKTLLPDQQLYWTSKAPATVTAWYPTDETVDLSDQTGGLAYVLRAEAPGATYDQPVTLAFTHALAKVRVLLSGTQAGQATQVEVNSYTRCANNRGSVGTDDGDKGWIQMMRTTYADGTECWEANVVPGVTIPAVIRPSMC